MQDIRSTIRPATPSTTQSWLLPWMLMAVLTLNILDRQVINVLGPAIGRDLQLSDSQMGLLGGLAFAVVYFVFGFPWGWLADRPRVSRVWVISGALGVWSAMTAACGLAPGYAQLLLARMGVAAGEAGCAPAAQSLIAEAAPRDRLARAMSIFGMGIPVGAFLGKTLGGLLTDAFGWRSAFLIVGAPGVLLAAVLLLVLKDPRMSGMTTTVVRPPSSFRQAAREILRSRTIIYIILASMVGGGLVAGGSFWGMMHFQRNLGMTPGQAGLYLGIQAGAAGIIGALGGGWLADGLAVRRARRYLLPAIVGMAASPPLLFFGWRTDSWPLAIVLMLLPTVFSNIAYGGMSAATQRLLSPNVRGSVSAIMTMIGTLAGIGIGITAFGVVSDLVRTRLPAGLPPSESVRVVLMGSAFLYLLPAFFYWRASRNLEAELSRFEAAE